MKVQIELSGSRCNTAVVRVEENGVLKRKTVKIDDLIQVFEKSCDELKTKKYVSLGGMPGNLFDLVINDEDLKERTYVLALPGEKRFATYRGRGEEEYLADYVRYPNLVYIIRTRKGKFGGSNIFAYKGELSMSSPLFHFPFGNVSLNDGSICYGNMQMGKLETGEDINLLVDKFFCGTYNGDFYQSLGTTNAGVSLKELLQMVNARKCEQFPDEILMPAKFATLADYYRECLSC